MNQESYAIPNGIIRTPIGRSIEKLETKRASLRFKGPTKMTRYTRIWGKKKARKSLTARVGKSFNARVTNKGAARDVFVTMERIEAEVRYHITIHL